MAKNYIQWKTKGMNRDTSASAFNAEFAFENVNLRLATNEGNTMMSWVNERGTKEIEVTTIIQAWDGEEAPKIKEETTNDEGDTVEVEVVKLLGTTIGTAVINHQLVLFTTDGDTSTTPDRIYVLKYSDEAQTKMTARLLFQGVLNFSVKYPLETMVAFEASYVQKVYWTDNNNQPRLINIAASQEKCAKWNAHPTELSYYFDFVPSFTMKESDVSITMNISAGGLFAPGVIQYVCTYINKYGQESNIAYISTLYYLTYLDRAASPEEKVTSSFSIKIVNADTNFDYVRLYSIQRTSLDSTALVKKLDDFPITGGTITYTDNGMYGSTVDPTELLYVGGKEIKALTMTSKDNTLFLGNITQKNFLVKSIQAYIDGMRDDADYWPGYNSFMDAFHSDTKNLDFDTVLGVYSHTQTLKHNHREITTFKGGEVYRLGFQLQKKTGEWSEPIYLCDYKNDKYPGTTITGRTVQLPTIAFDDFYLDEMAESYQKATGNDFFEMFTAIRPSIVYPTIGDRNVLCQGVLNPTVFNSVDRKDNSPFAQPSWFFRPYCFTDASSIWSESNDISTYGITVSREETPSDADSLISNSISEDLQYTTLYVLVADVKKSEWSTIVSRGSIKYTFSSGTTGSMAFIYCIPLEDYSKAESTIKCAFFGHNGWYCTVEYEDSLTNVEVSPDGGSSYFYLGFKVYKGLKQTESKYMMYYQKPTNNAPDPYVLMFYTIVGSKTNPTSSYLYTIKFSNYSAYPYLTKDDLGYILPFTHYCSLDTGDSYETHEVEGAYSLGDSVFDELSSKSTAANTQFYVDQSILTLNSPDIEFDTETQSYSFDGLHLRIVGMIPITGYTMAHSITTSSNMLPSYYNNDDDRFSAYKGLYGKGEVTDFDFRHSNICVRGGRRFITKGFWNDVEIKANADKSDGVEGGSRGYWLVYPWRRTGSMTSDVRDKESAASYCETKKESNSLYSINSIYTTDENMVYSTDGYHYEYPDIDTALHLTENEEVYNISMHRQYTGINNYPINYYPNIDKVLINTAESTDSDGNSHTGYEIIKGQVLSNGSTGIYTTAPISMKYKSTSHVVISMKENSQGLISIMPEVDIHTSYHLGETIGRYTPPSENNSYMTFWGDIMQFSQRTFYYAYEGIEDIKRCFDFLWLGELYKDVDDSNRFGGKTESALRANNWLIGGEAVSIEKSTDGSKNVVSLTWTEGDTYYQRYDCLKTYPFTTEDINQNTEILSFMCETHVNLDGRYDKNRNQLKGYLMRPDNFNLMNSVYSQKNNFFTSSKVDTEDVDELEYPNYITYSKTKQSGADVDEWTNVTLASVLEMDGDKGSITSLNRLNDQLIAFQDKGISQVLYNENVQISSTEGVPIELANSGKVQGKRYLSDTIGCSDKWSVMQTPKGIYFIDSNDKSIYLFNGQLNNLSLNGGFNAWAKNNIPVADDEHQWNPVDYQNFKTIYDQQNQDVMFIDADTALAYSEKFGCFTSFYNYEKAPFFENLDDTGIWIKDGKLWKHGAGSYCNFFGENKPYSMTLIANANPQMDKTFTNLEFRACLSGEGQWRMSNGDFTPFLPFDSIEAWDEYQHGKLNLSATRSSSSKAIMPHGTDNSILARKFRIWRCDIPRDNAPVSSEDIALGISRIKARPLDRIRNPWAYIKLFKSAAKEGEYLHKAEIHDIMATYFG